MVLVTVAAGCGGSSNANSEPADAPTVTIPADASETSVAPPLDANTETATTHLPKAPRCVSSTVGDTDASISGSDDAGSETIDAPNADSAGNDTASSSAGDTAADGGENASNPPLQIVNSGGSVLRSPRIVPITYDGDPNQDDIDDFIASIGCTPYWHAVASEYGIGDATAAAPVHITEPAPALIKDRDLEKWLRTNIEAKSKGWELPTPNSLYAIHFPSDTTVTLGGQESCRAFGGYHSSFTLTDGRAISYAVVVDCFGGIERVTTASSHELIEAATDPLPLTHPTYQHPDDAHLVYSLVSGGEVGDLCTRPSASFVPEGYPFWVQRSWSNLASLNHHDPCVPAAPGVYFNAIPDLPDTVDIKSFFGHKTRGIRIPIGESRTITLDLVSDGPIDPFIVKASDASGESPHLTFALSNTSGVAGQKLALTITKKSESARFGAEPFAISSSLGGRRFVSLGVVGH
ncbi:MAG: hypothetical protein NVSMB1_17490 [Polyangiales bacterium]